MCCACSKGALLSLGAGCDALFAGSATAVSSLVLRFRNNTGVFGTISHAKTTGSPSPNWRGNGGVQHLGIWGCRTAPIPIPQTTQDLTRVILQVVEAFLNTDDAFKESVDLLTRRQIQR